MIQYHSGSTPNNLQESIVRYAITKYLGHNDYLLTEVAQWIKTTFRDDGWNEYHYNGTLICKIHRPHSTSSDAIPFNNTLSMTIRYEVCI